jgi:hypothetical protein
MTVTSSAPAGGTQSFVHTLTDCWRRPSLTALEVLWRWSFGIPAMALVGYEATRVWNGAAVDMPALQRMSLFDPMGAVGTLAQAMATLLPPAEKVALWLLPLLGVAWVMVSAVGRGIVLRRADTHLHRVTGTLMLLQAVRLVALATGFALWFVCLRAASELAVNRPIAAGEEPNLVLYSALAIVATLGLFTLWAVSSWGLSVAPLLAMRQNSGAWASLTAAFRLGPLKAKLVEINLVMGIVKIALIVLAMVLSACPLPFESVATPQFMAWWYAVVTVLYFIASDFFHVAHLVAYLWLWRGSDGLDRASL